LTKIGKRGFAMAIKFGFEQTPLDEPDAGEHDDICPFCMEDPCECEDPRDPEEPNQ
jgi:hypothetical protein